MLPSAAMPKTKRVSVTVERALLDELRRAAGNDVKLSDLMSEAIRDEIRRRGLLALLDEMDERDPISPEDQEAGDRLWRAIESSSIPEPSQHLPTRAGRSESHSAKS